MKFTKFDKLRICMEYLYLGYFIGRGSFVYAMDEKDNLGFLGWKGSSTEYCPEISENTDPNTLGLCVLRCDFEFNNVVEDFNRIPDDIISVYAANIGLTKINRDRNKLKSRHRDD